MPIFLRVLIINGCWILWKSFSASIEIIVWFLSFSLLIWCIRLFNLCILKNPCIPGINPTWSWFMSFLMCCWIQLAKILLRIFCIYAHQWYWPLVFFFVCCLYLVLVSGWWWPCRMTLEVFLSLQIFWKSFRRIGISSTLNVW